MTAQSWLIAKQVSFTGMFQTDPYSQLATARLLGLSKMIYIFISKKVLAMLVYSFKLLYHTLSSDHTPGH